METVENDTKGQTSTAKDCFEETVQKESGSILLCTSLGILTVALALKCLGHRQSALLIAQSGASLLLFGVYNKILSPKSTK